MQAIILVGGEATRLRPLTCNMPKSMVPVLNTPFLEHVLRYLGNHGVKDIVLAQGHLPKLMDDYFQDGSRFGSRLTYSLETRPMNTAGAVKNAEQFLQDRFFVLNGDIFTKLDITAMLRFHLERKAKVTIALTPVEDPTAYGLIETNTDGRVSRFLEKPKKEEVTTNMINAGIYILEAEILKYIPAQTNYSFERQLFPLLLAKNEPVYAFASSDYWIDIGTPDKYFQLHRDLLRGKDHGYSPIKGQDRSFGRNCQIDPTAQIQGPVVLGDECVICRDVKITGPVILGPGCVVKEESTIQESLAWHKVTFGPRAFVKNTLMANDCYINTDCIIENSVIGDHITITRYTRLGPGSRIWPA